jgi:hypothetical protein
MITAAWARESGRQDEAQQPRELAKQQKALAQQDQFAQAQQVNREGQRQRFDRQCQREVGRGCVIPRRRQPTGEGKNGEIRRNRSNRIFLLLRHAPAVRPKGVEGHQGSERRAKIKPGQVVPLQTGDSPADRQHARKVRPNLQDETLS